MTRRHHHHQHTTHNTRTHTKRRDMPGRADGQAGKRARTELSLQTLLRQQVDAL
jgi:hypothetical protein